MSRGSSRAWRALALVGAGLIVCLVGMSLPPLSLPEVDPPCAYMGAILCAELPVDGAQLEAVLAAPENSRDMWLRDVLWDFPFLVLYAALLAGGFFLETRSRPVAALIIVAAALDAVENVALLLAIDGGATDALAATTRTAAHTKFALLAAGTALGGALIARSKDTSRVWRGAFAIASLVAAAGLVGIFAPWPLEVGALGLLLASCALLARALVGSFGGSGARGGVESRHREPTPPS